MDIIRNRRNNFGYQSRVNKYRRPLVFSGEKIRTKKSPSVSPILKSSWKIVLSVILLLIAIYYILFSAKFQITDIIIQGNDLTSEQRIKSYIPAHANIFLFNIDKAKDQILDENPEIKDIEIYRGIPNALKIVILEFDNKMIWETAGVQFLVSSQGRATKQITPTDAFAYPKVVDTKNIVINLGDYIVSSSFVSFVLNIQNNCFDVTNTKPTYYSISETTFDLNLYTDAGIYAKLNTMRSSTKQLENFKRVLISKKPEIKEYVDLRIDGLAYYK